ncbi:glutaredoxin family protein [Chlorobium phaeovibrioides]|uniref:Glutaredoxin family protein n=2 Tax=Chlorobium phaeovibrioides TaxID=1094 RepID=A0A3S0U0X8_CHLPH|nr:glutaredoxin family protein [Chlorobium phaeovibrioides]HCD36224.1 glutaredoxin family protein [Chlorobium sp.]KAA6232325.1 glutaredoxin family protein [Chlorobium phaeovibrioides]MWV54680.1 glutaredoxin family protein [Chlorobium phaeovibrioides]QEQ57167.1 glutaredoxin family protein [Chlorobium phaeovibrioides]RTY36820.1 glutaredoxin family protein [Chlorobium phaeovibrioides]
MNCPVPQVTIYGKPGCCLCDEALEVMSRIQVRVPFLLEKVDITSSADLHSLYGNDIPVIHIDGREAFRQRVDEARFLLLLSPTD